MPRAKRDLELVKMGFPPFDKDGAARANGEVALPDLPPGRAEVRPKV